MHGLRTQLLRLALVWAAVWLFGAASPSPQPKPIQSPQVAQKQTEPLFPSIPYPYWLTAAGLGLSAVALVSFHPGLKGLGRMQIQGLILLRQSPGWSNTHAELSGAEAEFEQQYRKFSATYAQLGLKLSFSGDGMKIEIGSARSLPVFKTGIPQRLQHELQTLIDTLPTDKYFIQVQIDGKIAGLNQILNFSLANHGKQLGLHLNQISRLSLKGVFFNG